MFIPGEHNFGGQCICPLHFQVFVQYNLLMHKIQLSKIKNKFSDDYHRAINRFLKRSLVSPHDVVAAQNGRLFEIR